MLDIKRLQSWCYKATSSCKYPDISVNILVHVIYTCGLSLFITHFLENYICYLYQIQDERLLVSTLL